MAAEAVLIVDAAALRVLRVNPAAARLLHACETALLGTPLLSAFDAAGRHAIRGSIGVARAGGRNDVVVVRAAGGGAFLRAKISCFWVGSDAYVLLRLSTSNTGDAPASMRRSPVFDAVDGAATGFLMTDAGLRVEYANRAFLEMTGLPSWSRIEGKSLLRWLRFTAGDMALFRKQLLRRQATTLMTARLRPERPSARAEVRPLRAEVRPLRAERDSPRPKHSSPRQVEVCAVAVADGPLTCWGFTVRELPSLN
jgi:hypothetical protein